jgi:hypothetical protein
MINNIGLGSNYSIVASREFMTPRCPKTPLALREAGTSLATTTSSVAFWSAAVLRRFSSDSKEVRLYRFELITGCVSDRDRVDPPTWRCHRFIRSETKP